MKYSRLTGIFAAAILTACGSGGGNSVAGIDAGGTPDPVATTVVSQGEITGFGSVIVNGVRYDTSSATFTIDDNPGSESDLAVGQVVTVRGTLGADGSTGTASSIVFDDLVEGPVQAIDPDTETLIVLGQTVQVTVDTSFEADIVPASLAGLAVGDIVEVSGFFDAAGIIVASHIEIENPGGEFEVTGIATNVQAGAMTLEINALVVDYSGALVEDFPNGAPEAGQLVEAKGTTLGAGGELIATRLEFEGGNDFGDGQVEIEGFITRFAAATDFDIGGLPVTTTASTVYENGNAADLDVNRKIEAEGSVNASGVLVATKIEFKQAGFLRAEGLVEDVQAARVTVMGIPINVRADTELKDSSDADVRAFGLDDLNVGDYVEIRGYSDATGFVATRLERDDDRGEAALRGFVDSVAPPLFEILGVTIATAPGTQFRDNDTPIDSDTFFARAPGRLVDVDGTFSGGTLAAEEASIED
ncbi:MAG: DUF5666 domain-containing protein [Woeseiaceae bacterium]|nr:DUF5666 domain-containing protein [Woeseiaceae bacterium]